LQEIAKSIGISVQVLNDLLMSPDVRLRDDLHQLFANAPWLLELFVKKRCAHVSAHSKLDGPAQIFCLRTGMLVETEDGKHVCCKVDAEFSPLHHVAALDSNLLQVLRVEHVRGQKEYFDQKRAAAAKKEKKEKPAKKQKEEESSVSDSGPPLKKAKKAEKKEKKQKKTEVFKDHNSTTCIAAVTSKGVKSQCGQSKQKGWSFCRSHLAKLGDDKSQTKITFFVPAQPNKDSGGLGRTSDSAVDEGGAVPMEIDPANNNAKSEEEESDSSDLSEEEEEEYLSEEEEESWYQ
jgi:hypothetical protein